MLVEVDGFYFNPRKVTAIKASALEDGKCTIFVEGQSSMEGFVVEGDAESIAEEIGDALEED